MNGFTQRNLQSQRGVSLSGLIVGLGLIFFVAVLGMRVFPSVMEFRSAKEGLAAAKRMGGTPNEMRNAFNKHADINMIDSIAGKDLIVTKNNNEVELAFDYEKRIDLFANAYLGLHFAATTDPTGVVASAPDTTEK